MLKTISHLLRRYTTCMMLLVFLTAQFVTPVVNAAGGLMVAPTLVELDNRQKSTTLNVINGDTKTQTYRISLINYRMDEDGKVHEAETPTGQDKFATELIRFSPRQVTLKPGESQTVRVLFRRIPNLQDGEYRSHLLFRKIPDPEPRATMDTDTTKLQIKITALFGVTIPVIVTQGTLTAKSEIKDLELVDLDDGRSGISMRIERSGNQSLRGNIIVKADGETVAQVNNLAIYLSTTYRQVVLPISSDESLLGKTVRVEYHETKKNGGSVIAEAVTVFR